jgi:hypothetical protein
VAASSYHVSPPCSGCGHGDGNKAARRRGDKVSPSLSLLFWLIERVHSSSSIGGSNAVPVAGECKGQQLDNAGPLLACK